MTEHWEPLAVIDSVQLRSELKLLLEVEGARASVPHKLTGDVSVRQRSRYGPRSKCVIYRPRWPSIVVVNNSRGSDRHRSSTQFAFALDLSITVDRYITIRGCNKQGCYTVVHK